MDSGERRPALVAENIHKRFGTLEVLKGISLTAHEGDVIALLGSSGSGKSTFLRCLNLLETPEEGRIFVGGEPSPELIEDWSGLGLSDPHPLIPRPVEAR